MKGKFDHWKDNLYRVQEWIINKARRKSFCKAIITSLDSVSADNNVVQKKLEKQGRILTNLTEFEKVRSLLGA